MRGRLQQGAAERELKLAVHHPDAPCSVTGGGSWLPCELGTGVAHMRVACREAILRCPGSSCAAILQFKRERASCGKAIASAPLRLLLLGAAFPLLGCLLGLLARGLFCLLV